MALLASYNFDEPSGAYLDVSGNGLDFTDLGAGGRTTGHTGSGALTTNGADFPTRAPFGQTAARTVMLWLKAPSQSTAWWAVEWHVSSINSGSWGVLFINGQIHIQARNSSGFARASAAFPTDDAWHHYAGTYDGSNVRLYVDGALADTTPLAGPLRADANSLNLLSTAPSSSMVGDDLRVYDETLDQATISALMDTPVSSGPAPIQELTGSLSLTLDTDGTLTVPPASVESLQGSLSLALSTSGTLEMPPATVESLSGSLDLALSFDGTLSDPNATDGDYTAEVDHVTYSATALVPEHTAEVEA